MHPSAISSSSTEILAAASRIARDLDRLVELNGLEAGRAADLLDALPVQCQAQWSWEVAADDEIPLGPGEIVLAVSSRREEWCTAVTASGQRGLVPTNYLTPLPYPSPSPAAPARPSTLVKPPMPTRQPSASSAPLSTVSSFSSTSSSLSSQPIVLAPPLPRGSSFAARSAPTSDQPPPIRQLSRTGSDQAMEEYKERPLKPAYKPTMAERAKEGAVGLVPKFGRR